MFEENKMKGSDIALPHVAENIMQTSAIYVGSIVSGRNIFNRAATLKAFQTKMDDFVHTRPNIRYYSRPVSDDGVRTAAKLGYKPVKQSAFKTGEMIFVK